MVGLVSTYGQLGFITMPRTVEFLALDLLNNHRNFRLVDKVLQFRADLGFQLFWGPASRLDLADQRRGDSSIRAHRNNARYFRLLPDVDVQNVSGPFQETFTDGIHSGLHNAVCLLFRRSRFVAGQLAPGLRVRLGPR